MIKIFSPSVIGPAIAIFVGVARGAGAVILFSDDQGANARWAGTLLAVISLWLIVAGIVFLVKKTHAARNVLAAGMVAFWIGGIVNGFLLYGAPQLSGQIINIILTASVLVCVYLKPKETYR